MDDVPGTSQNPNPIVGKKRKHSASSRDDDDDQPAVKYLELAEVFTLDRFSDEVLFQIFNYLDSFTLLSVEKVCTRFYGLVQDHNLWTDIDLLAKQQSIVDLKYSLNKVNHKTKSVKINGYLGGDGRYNTKEERVCLVKSFIPKCENLVDLELHGVFIDFATARVQDFPKNMKRLVFKEVSVRWPDNAPTVFQKMDKSLIWLEELRVESCTWFHPYDIMLFSKCPSLKRLSMRGCQNLSDFVPYGSMASRFGFKSLEYLDVRDTPITDADLQCFNAILTLKELLLECPNYLRGKPPVPLAPGECKFRSVSHPPPPQLPTSDSSSSSSSSSSNSDDNQAANDGEPCTSRKRSNHEVSNVMMTIDLRNHTRTVILHGRVCEIPESDFRRNPQGHVGSLLRHPHFWDMIDRQTGTDCGPCVATKPQICPVTNRGVACFGRPLNPIDQNVIWIRIGHRPSDNTFERLSLRHYKRITDDSLRHLVECSPSLVYLDVSGCGITQEGVDAFKARKPECKVVCEHLENPV